MFWTLHGCAQELVVKKNGGMEVLTADDVAYGARLPSVKTCTRTVVDGIRLPASASGYFPVFALRTLTQRTKVAIKVLATDVVHSAHGRLRVQYFMNTEQLFGFDSRCPLSSTSILFLPRIPAEMVA
jgi:hypothetical protein